MTYYSMVGGKDLSVPGVDLQCTCHFSIQVSSFTPVLSSTVVLNSRDR